jgi:hypothetical protein
VIEIALRPRNPRTSYRRTRTSDPLPPCCARTGCVDCVQVSSDPWVTVRTGSIWWDSCARRDRVGMLRQLSDLPLPVRQVFGRLAAGALTEKTHYSCDRQFGLPVHSQALESQERRRQVFLPSRTRLTSRCPPPENLGNPMAPKLLARGSRHAVSATMCRRIYSLRHEY